MVGKLGRMALWTCGCQGRLQKIMGPSHVPSGFGMSLYWIWHMTLLLYLLVFFSLDLELLQGGEPLIKRAGLTATTGDIQIDAAMGA
jgi:hypothetical protein